MGLVVSNKPVCDFCTSQPVTWDFECADFVMARIGGEDHESVGNWAACAVCAELIKAGDRKGLLHRAVEVESERFGFIPDEGLAGLAVAHEGFWRHMTGNGCPAKE